MHQLLEKLLTAIALPWRTGLIWSALILLMLSGIVGAYIDLHLPE